MRTQGKECREEKGKARLTAPPNAAPDADPAIEAKLHSKARSCWR